jgi:hypothetical protein
MWKHVADHDQEMIDEGCDYYLKKIAKAKNFLEGFKDNEAKIQVLLVKEDGTALVYDYPDRDLLMQVIQHDITIFNGNIRAMDGD